MKWKKLKEFCNSLDEKQLEQKVILWREDEAISRIEAHKLEEDHYINPEDCEDGCYPISEATESIENLKKVYDAGTPLLLEDF